LARRNPEKIHPRTEGKNQASWGRVRDVNIRSPPKQRQGSGPKRFCNGKEGSQGLARDVSFLARDPKVIPPFYRFRRGTRGGGESLPENDADAKTSIQKRDEGK